MSWAEIKKAINSNISKSLDVLITEKCNEILTKLNSVYNTVTVAGNIPSVKSVQRGKVNYAGEGVYYDFTINPVNMNKSIVFIDGHAKYAYYNNYSFELLNSNTIRAYANKNTNSYNYFIYDFTWQVIEFY